MATDAFQKRVKEEVARILKIPLSSVNDGTRLSLKPLDDLRNSVPELRSLYCCEELGITIRGIFSQVGAAH